jgi:hypothetical protein
MSHGFSVVVARKHRGPVVRPGDLVRVIATGLSRQHAHAIVKREVILAPGECVHVFAPGASLQAVRPLDITLRVAREC